MNYILQLLKEKLITVNANIFIGTPETVPVSKLPCIILSPNSTSVDMADNVRYWLTHNINITVINDIRNYLGGNDNALAGQLELMAYMGETSSDVLVNNSILNIILSNDRLADNVTIESTSMIDYSIRNRSDDLTTIEVTMSLNIKQNVRTN